MLSEQSGIEKTPDCEQCRRPDVLEANNEACEVYRLASIDAMGLSIMSIAKTSEILGVADPHECLLKVSELTTAIRANRDIEPQGQAEGE